MRDALIVFAKRPTPGAVKTRLTSLLRPKDAAALYAAFLEDGLTQYETLGVDVRLYFAPTHGRSGPVSIPRGVTVLEQRGDTLGERMETAFRESFDAGYSRLVIIGTDHPTLPSAFVRRAFSALTDHKVVVVGPSEDGGFYLLGTTVPRPVLFRGMTYSHAGVFEETLTRIESDGARAVTLPMWYDVDTPAALGRLAGDLESTLEGADRTRAVVERIRASYVLPDA